MFSIYDTPAIVLKPASSAEDLQSILFIPLLQCQFEYKTAEAFGKWTR